MRGSAVISSFLYFVGCREAHSAVTEGETALLENYARNATTIVELGVYEGKTSRALREVMHPLRTLWLIDPFLPGLLGLNWQYLVAQAEVSKSKNGTFRILRQMSLDVAATWRGTFDFLFIDADHSYEAVKSD